MSDLSTGSLVLVAVAAVFTTVAAVCDLRTRRIPNKLTLPVFFAGWIYQIVDRGWTGPACPARPGRLHARPGKPTHPTGSTHPSRYAGFVTQTASMEHRCCSSNSNGASMSFAPGQATASRGSSGPRECVL